MSNNNEKIDFFKKHADTLCIISIIIGSMLWINGKFTDVQKEIYGVKTEIAVMKTVMIMKQVMPAELAKGDIEK